MSDLETRSALRTFATSFWPFGLGILLLILVALPAEARRVYWPQQDILDAIREVESGGREQPPDGDQGQAIGPFQIHRAYWVDAVASEPSLGGVYDDCRKRAYAEKVVAAYMRLYARRAWDRGRAEVIARIHNGGPRGDRIAATLGYWRRVLRKLPP